jgi:hypothetical protein
VEEFAQVEIGYGMNENFRISKKNFHNPIFFRTFALGFGSFSPILTMRKIETTSESSCFTYVASRCMCPCSNQWNGEWDIPD